MRNLLNRRLTFLDLLIAMFILGIILGLAS